MPRPPLVIGSWGRIRRRQVRKGVWVADARFRDHDGVTRQIARTGPTAQKAEDALKEALTQRLALAGDDVTADTTLNVVGPRWFDDEVAGQKAINTERRYREILDGVILPGLGGIRLRELTVARLDRFLKLTATSHGPATARVTKTVLSGIVGMATRQGALSSNPLRDVATVRVPHKEVVVLDIEQLWDLRRRMYADELAVLQDLPEPIDFMMGTGARIGEVLATRWRDLRLDEPVPKAIVRATAVWVKGTGMVIQEHPKSESSRRELTLPDFVADTLRRRRVEQAPNDLDLVFPSVRGTVREPANMRRQWRELRSRIGYDWVVPHTFRKTVATLVDDVEKASGQLGHSGTAVTKRNYIPKTHVAPDIRDVLDRIQEPTFTPRKQGRKTGNEGEHKQASTA